MEILVSGDNLLAPRPPGAGPDFPREHAIRTALLVLPALVLGLAACSDDPPARTAATPPAEVLSPSPTSDPLPSAAPTSAAPSPSASVVRPPATTAPGAPAATTSPQAPEDPLASAAPRETAPPVGLPACDARALTLTDADAVYTADAVRELFTVRTTGPDCQLPGAYPSVQVLDGAGAPVAPVGQGGPGLPSPSGAPVTLSRSTSLSFSVGTRRDGPCVPAATVTATLAGTGTALRAATGMQVCQGALATGPLQRLGDDE